MAQAETFNHAYATSTPRDANDPPRFGQPAETTKDVITLELRKYLAGETNATTGPTDAQLSGLRAELPTIEKYESYATLDPYETVARVQRKHTDLHEALPHIVVSGISGSEVRQSIGTPYVETWQDAPRISLGLGSSGHFSITDGSILQIQTIQNGVPTVSNLVLSASRIVSPEVMTSLSPTAVARLINEQALYVRAHTPLASEGALEIWAPGSRSIEVLPGTSRGLLDASAFGSGCGAAGNIASLDATSRASTGCVLTSTAGSFTADMVTRGLYVTIVTTTSGSRANLGSFPILGVSEDGSQLTYKNTHGTTLTAGVNPVGTWFIGAKDTHLNPLRPPKHRYSTTWDLSLQIDLLTEDEAQRAELTDAVLSYFGFFAESQCFTYLGRSSTDPEDTREENYLVTLRNPVRLAGEQEVQRTGDQNDKIYTSAIQLDLTTVMYLDRIVYWPGTTTPAIVTESTFTSDESLVQPS